MIAFMGLPGGYEWVVIAIVAVLIFGKRLPTIARSIGSSFVEFKKGISGVETELKELDKDAGIERRRGDS